MTFKIFSVVLKEDCGAGPDTHTTVPSHSSPSPTKYKYKPTHPGYEGDKDAIIPGNENIKKSRRQREENDKEREYQACETKTSETTRLRYQRLQDIKDQQRKNVEVYDNKI